MTISSVQFIAAKETTPRSQLELPTLHFVVMDDWVVKTGEKALFAWLKFYTWCDRTDKSREYDAIPNSMNKIAKKLTVGKDTLYNAIIKPLWNYGLIDLQEVVINGTVCVNIIVYKYPQNNKKLETEPLEKVRDYDTEYHSKAKENGKKGGRPKTEKQVPAKDVNAGMVLNENQGGGSEREPEVVLNENRGGSDTEPNNSFKYLSNSFKYLFNLDDDLKEDKALTFPPSIFYEKNKTIIKQFTDYGVSRGIHPDFIHEIKEYLIRVDYLLSYESIGTAINKTLEGIEAATVNHVPNYFIAVLENEVRKEQSILSKHQNE